MLQDCSSLVLPNTLVSTPALPKSLIPDVLRVHKRAPAARRVGGGEVEIEERGVLGDDDHTTPYPLHGEGRSAKRLVVIRDLKTVAGPNKDSAGLRHMRCLFEDLQLALYARAWELLHPNDRVVGVGATEVGEFTTHYVELDSDLASVADDLEIGEIRIHVGHSCNTVRGHYLSLCLSVLGYLLAKFS